MEVKFMRRLTESHIDALYEAMEERMMERMEALENNKYNEEQQEELPTRIHRLEWFLEKFERTFQWQNTEACPRIDCFHPKTLCSKLELVFVKISSVPC